MLIKFIFSMKMSYELKGLRRRGKKKHQKGRFISLNFVRQ